MITNLLIGLVEKLLRGKLTDEQKNRLVVHMLDGVGALPLRGIIQASEGTILLNGEPLDTGMQRVLYDQARAIIGNKAWKICTDQADFLAVQQGLLKGDELLFYRAAIWWSNTVKQYLAILAREDTTTVLE